MKIVMSPNRRNLLISLVFLLAAVVFLLSRVIPPEMVALATGKVNINVIPPDIIAITTAHMAIIIGAALLLVVVFVLLWLFWDSHRHNRSETLRRTFQKWLLLVVACIFVITFAATFASQTRQADRNAESVLRQQQDYIEEQISLNLGNMNDIKRRENSRLLEKTRAVALLLEADPQLATPDALAEICKELGIDEICVTDVNGEIVACHPERYLYHDISFADYENLRKYMVLTRDLNATVIEEPRLNISGDDNDESYYQHYAGVPRLDQPGIVQGAIAASKYEQALRAASVEHLAESYTIGRTGYMLICQQDTIVSINDAAWVGRDISDYGIKKGMLTADYGFFKAELNGERVYCAHRRHNEYSIVAVYPLAEVYANRNVMALWNIILYSLLFALTYVLVLLLLERTVVRSIGRTNYSLERITAGDLEERVNVHSSEEFNSLSVGINKTVEALKTAIAEAAARIDKELEFAKAIQISSLPGVFPPYPERPEFDLYATMHTAREVGGDFYDFFLIGKDSLGLVMADVSGKGIPAALFMMTAKTHIKNGMQSGGDLAAVMAAVNDQLCENNEAGMFVTAFVAVLNFEKDEMTWVNCGHNWPLLQTAGGRFEWMKSKASLFLGSMEGVRYRSYTTPLQKGDTLFLYTDGVTEAMDPDDGLYGNERLEEILNQGGELSVEDILNKVKQDVDEFAAGAEQADDITMLALRYNSKTITVPADRAQMDTVSEFVGSELEKSGCTMKTMHQLLIAAEEIFVNIASYAYAPEQGDATITLAIGGVPPQITLRFTDSGIPFNPLEREDPDISLSAEEREIGGLGIFMVKKSMDKVEYVNRDGQNVLTLTKII